ncbi:rod shape-determining protein MreD [Porphyromonas pogonae]|uniref:rod shape-determining protein MreD n=1 Tax=Porphyromonas pogonae TaxID=867595 RepID=UPI002E793C59|nr:rod shape-determining protein MreD [Porphyromonas pogonae]
MFNNWVRFILVSIIIILLQVWEFTPLALFKIATPFIYPIVLFFLPINTRESIMTVVGFCIGLILDTLSGTPGLNTSAFTLTAFARNYLTSPLCDDEVNRELIPSRFALGNGAFFLLLFEVMLLNTLVLFLLDALSLFDFVYFLKRFGSSFVFSYVVCVIFFLIFQQAEKDAK